VSKDYEADPTFKKAKKNQQDSVEGWNFRRDDGKSSSNNKSILLQGISHTKPHTKWEQKKYDEMLTHMMNDWENELREIDGESRDYFEEMRKSSDEDEPIYMAEEGAKTYGFKGLDGGNAGFFATEKKDRKGRAKELVSMDTCGGLQSGALGLVGTTMKAKMKFKEALSKERRKGKGMTLALKGQPKKPESPNERQLMVTKINSITDRLYGGGKKGGGGYFDDLNNEANSLIVKMTKTQVDLKECMKDRKKFLNSKF
jgi:hypothetical protein